MPHFHPRSPTFTHVHPRSPMSTHVHTFSPIFTLCLVHGLFRGTTVYKQRAVRAQCKESPTNLDGIPLHLPANVYADGFRAPAMSCYPLWPWAFLSEPWSVPC